MSPRVNTQSEPIIFADGSSIILSSKNLMSSVLCQTQFSHVSKWFIASMLAVNLLLLTLQPYMGFIFCTRLFQAFVSLTNWLQIFSFNFFQSYITSSLHLFFGCPLVLIPMRFHSVIFLTSFISSMYKKLVWYISQNYAKMQR